MLKALFLLAMGAWASYSQSPGFEVASIKPSPPREPGRPTTVGMYGGPFGGDPGRWTCENMPLSALISEAYHLRAHELIAPDWLESATFHITATLPSAVTKAQFRVMLQTLLAERFGLKAHREPRSMAGFELVVAKNGPKFKEAAAEPSKAAGPEARSRGPLVLAKDGYPDLPAGMKGMAIMRGRARAQWLGQTAEELAENLGYQAQRPVVDATGLPGKYDFVIYWMIQPLGAQPSSAESAPAASDPAGPNLFTALQEQLGLKLESKKVTIDVLVVDHVERVPTEN